MQKLEVEIKEEEAVGGSSAGASEAVSIDPLDAFMSDVVHQIEHSKVCTCPRCTTIPQNCIDYGHSFPFCILSDKEIIRLFWSLIADHLGTRSTAKAASWATALLIHV